MTKNLFEFMNEEKRKNNEIKPEQC